jgi:hypothetical protein
MDYFKSCFDQVNVIDGIILALALVLLSGIATLMLFHVHAGLPLFRMLIIIMFVLLSYLCVSSIRPEAVKNIYLFGIMLWITTIMLLISLYQILFPNVSLVASLITKSNIYYLIPIISCTITLLWNLSWLATKEGAAKDDYENEVKLVEFVERNGYYIILSITAIFIYLGILQIKHLSPFFYLWMITSIAIQACGVLPLIWAPVNDHRRLAWLRHFKTVWYTFSIYIFFFGIIALGKSLVPNVINILK